jgi:hypothetical protein
MSCQMFKTVLCTEHLHSYRVIHSSSTILRTFLGRSSAAENVNKDSSDSPPFPELQPVNVYVALIIMIVEFYKLETISFNIKCQSVPSIQ